MLKTAKELLESGDGIQMVRRKKREVKEAAKVENTLRKKLKQTNAKVNHDQVKEASDRDEARSRKKEIGQPNKLRSKAEPKQDPNDNIDMKRQDIRNSHATYTNYAGNPKTILEIASGDGRWTKELKKIAPDAHIEVLDKDPDYMEQCKVATGNKLTYHIADARNLPEDVKEKKFDVIWVQGLAQYFSDAEFKRFLDSLKNILSSDGKIFLKEQFFCNKGYCKTMFVKDSYIRSLACFKAAISDYTVTAADKFSFDQEFYPQMTFILKLAGQKDRWTNKCHYCTVCAKSTHSDCEGQQSTHSDCEGQQ